MQQAVHRPVLSVEGEAATAPAVRRVVQAAVVAPSRHQVAGAVWVGAAGWTVEAVVEPRSTEHRNRCRRLHHQDSSPHTWDNSPPSHPTLRPHSCRGCDHRCRLPVRARQALGATRVEDGGPQFRCPASTRTDSPLRTGSCSRRQLRPQPPSWGDQRRSGHVPTGGRPAPGRSLPRQCESRKGRTD